MPAGRRASLTRSKATPIVVILPRPHTHSERRKAHQQFWKDVSEHIPRWRRATLTLPLEADMFPLLESCAHEPTAFKLIMPPENHYVIDLFRGVAPRLRHLELDYLSLRNWTAPFLRSSHLTVLLLTDVEHSGPTIHQVATILRSCGAWKSLPCRESPSRTASMNPITIHLLTTNPPTTQSSPSHYPGSESCTSALSLPTSPRKSSAYWTRRSALA